MRNNRHFRQEAKRGHIEKVSRVKTRKMREWTKHVVNTCNLNYSGESRIKVQSKNMKPCLKK
jgi:hypothetical protein